MINLIKYLSLIIEHNYLVEINYLMILFLLGHLPFDYLIYKTLDFTSILFYTKNIYNI